MTPFLELLAPPLCAACVSFGGIHGGIELGDLAVGVGSLNRRTNDGQIEHDTVFASVAYRAASAGRLSAGIFAAETFNPTPEGGPRTFQAGPWVDVGVVRHVSVRLYGIPDVRMPAHSQAMFSVRFTF